MRIVDMVFQEKQSLLNTLFLEYMASQQTNTRVSHMFNTCLRDFNPEFYSCV